MGGFWLAILVFRSSIIFPVFPALPTRPQRGLRGPVQRQFELPSLIEWMQAADAKEHALIKASPTVILSGEVPETTNET